MIDMWIIISYCMFEPIMKMSISLTHSNYVAQKILIMIDYYANKVDLNMIKDN